MMKKDQIIKLFADSLTVRMNHIVNAPESDFHPEKFQLLVDTLGPYLNKLDKNRDQNDWNEIQNCLVIIEHSLKVKRSLEYVVEGLDDYLEHLTAFCSQLIYDAINNSGKEFNYSSLFRWFQRLSAKKEYAKANASLPFLDLFQSFHELEPVSKSFEMFAGDPENNDTLLYALMKLVHYIRTGNSERITSLLRIQDKQEEVHKHYVYYFMEIEDLKSAEKHCIHRLDICAQRRIEQEENEQAFVEKASLKGKSPHHEKRDFIWVNYSEYTMWYSSTLIQVYMEQGKIDQVLNLVTGINIDRQAFSRSFRTECYERISPYLNESQRADFFRKVFEADSYIFLDIEEFCQIDQSWKKMIEACNMRLSRLSDINVIIEQHAAHLKEYPEELFSMYKAAILEYTRRDSSSTRHRTIIRGMENLKRIDESSRELINLIQTMYEQFKRRSIVRNMLDNYIIENNLQSKVQI